MFGQPLKVLVDEIEMVYWSAFLKGQINWYLWGIIGFSSKCFIFTFLWKTVIFLHYLQPKKMRWARNCMCCGKKLQNTMVEFDLEPLLYTTRVFTLVKRLSSSIRTKELSIFFLKASNVPCCLLSKTIISLHKQCSGIFLGEKNPTAFMSDATYTYRDLNVLW